MFCLQSSHVQAIIRGIGTAGLLRTPLVSIRANQQNQLFLCDG